MWNQPSTRKCGNKPAPFIGHSHLCVHLKQKTVDSTTASPPALTSLEEERKKERIQEENQVKLDRHQEISSRRAAYQTLLFSSSSSYSNNNNNKLPKMMRKQKKAKTQNFCGSFWDIPNRKTRRELEMSQSERTTAATHNKLVVRRHTTKGCSSNSNNEELERCWWHFGRCLLFVLVFSCFSRSRRLRPQSETQTRLHVAFFAYVQIFSTTRPRRCRDNFLSLFFFFFLLLLAALACCCETRRCFCMLLFSAAATATCTGGGRQWRDAARGRWNRNRPRDGWR